MKMRSVLTMLPMAATLGLAMSPAQAGIIFDAAADWSLRLDSIIVTDDPGGEGLSGIEVLGEANVFDSDAFSNADMPGYASADYDVMVDPEIQNPLEINDAVALMAMAMGEAGGSGLSTSTAEAFALPEGFVTISNNSDQATYELNLTVDYLLEAMASVDSLTQERAFASASIQLTSQMLVNDLVNQVLTADTEFGEQGGLLDDSIPLQITLAPGESDILSLFTDVQGSGESELLAVPVPTSLALLLFGGLLALRRR